MIDPNLISLAGNRAQAAAAQARQQEEQEMTGYSDDELGGRWEFKILRSGIGAFGNPEKLREALDQEARAGWELLEKFDNQRVRLRRPVAARRDDHQLDFDPYRTWIGVSDAGVVVRVWIGAAVVALLMGTALLAVFLLNR